LQGKARSQLCNKLKADKGIAVALREIELRKEKDKGGKDGFDAFAMEL